MPNPPRGSFQSMFRYGQPSRQLVHSTQFSNDATIFSPSHVYTAAGQNVVQGRRHAAPHVFSQMR